MRDYYFTIIHLDSPVNTPGDQWGIAFLKKGTSVTAFLTDMRDSATPRQIVTTFHAGAPERFERGRTLASGGDFDAVNIGSCAIDAKTMTIYFSAPRPGGIRGDYDIYAGHLVHDGDTFAITGAAPLSDNVNKDSAWDAQPALSPDGQTLYFASDRAGGMGGRTSGAAKNTAASGAMHSIAVPR